MTYHLGADYLEDPDGTFVSQPKKYIDKFADTYKRLFNADPPIDKNDHPELDTSDILEGDMAAKYLTMVGQPKKYIDKRADTYKRLFKDLTENAPKRLLG